MVSVHRSRRAVWRGVLSPVTLERQPQGLGVLRGAGPAPHSTTTSRARSSISSRPSPTQGGGVLEAEGIDVDQHPVRRGVLVDQGVTRAGDLRRGSPAPRPGSRRSVVLPAPSGPLSTGRGPPGASRTRRRASSRVSSSVGRSTVAGSTVGGSAVGAGQSGRQRLEIAAQAVGQQRQIGTRPQGDQQGVIGRGPRRHHDAPLVLQRRQARRRLPQGRRAVLGRGAQARREAPR